MVCSYLMGTIIAQCKGIQISESWKYLLVESGILSFGIRNIQLKESELPLTIGIRKPSSTNWNPESRAWNPESKTVLDSLTLADH